MKIGMAIARLEESGGMEKLVLRLTESLRLLRHDVRIATLAFDPHGCHPGLVMNSAIDVVRAPPLKSTSLLPPRSRAGHRGLDAFAETFRRLAAFRALAEALKDVDALIIHDQESLLATPHFRDLNPAAPILWMVNQEVNPRSLRAHYWIYRHYRRSKSRAPFAAVLGIPGAIALAHELKRGLASVDLLTTYDEKNRVFAEQTLRKRARVVFAGADVDGPLRQAAPVRRARTRTEFRILSIGYLFKYRRYEDIIEATAALWRKHSLDVHLTIVGSGGFSPEYRQELLTLIDKLKLHRRVAILGHVTEIDLQALRRDADAFVFVNDGLTWGIAVFEAAAESIPIIITQNIGAADLIRHGRHGWVVPPRDPVAVTNALLEIATDPLAAAEVAARTRREVVPLVSWHMFTERMVEAIEAASPRGA